MALTDKFIQNAKPGTHADYGGLYLRVRTNNGAKKFIYRDQRNGECKWTAVGDYPKLSLAEARKRAAAIKSGALRDSAKAFEGAFEDWLEHISKHVKRPETVQAWFDANILKSVGNKSLMSLSRADYTALLKKVVDRGSPVMANRIFSQLKSMLEYCKDQGWVETNVLEGVRRKNIGGKEQARTRALTLDEIGSKVFNANLTPMMRWPLYLMILTGLRSSEALWVLEHRKLEHIPAKGGVFHKIPPIPAIRAVLKIAPTPPSDARAMAKALRRLKADFTPHDLRRTFATRLGDLGVLPHVVEKLLCHKMEGVMAVYNRAEFWEDRTAALKIWAKTLREARKKART